MEAYLQFKRSLKNYSNVCSPEAALMPTVGRIKGHTILGEVTSQRHMILLLFPPLSDCSRANSKLYIVEYFRCKLFLKNREPNSLDLIAIQTSMVPYQNLYRHEVLVRVRQAQQSFSINYKMEFSIFKSFCRRKIFHFATSEDIGATYR